MSMYSIFLKQMIVKEDQMVPIFYIKVTGLTQLQSKIFRSFLRVFFCWFMWHN